MLIGIEVEACVNWDEVSDSSNLKKSEIGHYHSPVRVKDTLYWDTQRDSSIRTQGEYQTTLEFTTIPFEHTDIKNVLDEFKTIFGKNKKLDDVLLFNSSCGMHIHFTPVTKVMLKNTYPTIAKHLHDKAVKIYNRVSIGGSYNSDDMMNHYKRSYSQSWELYEERQKLNPTRRSDINYTCLAQSGYEWRSPHLLGVQSWEQFEEYVTAYVDALATLDTERLESVPIVIKTEIPMTTIYRDRNDRLRRGKLVPMSDKKHVPLMRNSEVIITFEEEQQECVISI